MTPPMFTHDDVALLLAPDSPPCLSLYQPTHRHYPENAQDPIRFGNLLRDLATALKRDYPESDAGTLLAPVHEASLDKSLWDNTAEGLAFFCAPGMSRCFTLHASVEAFTSVGDAFRLTPLIRLAQTLNRYDLLSLNRREIRLFQGNGAGIAEVPLAPGVPRTIEERWDRNSQSLIKRWLLTGARRSVPACGTAHRRSRKKLRLMRSGFSGPWTAQSRSFIPGNPACR